MASSTAPRRRARPPDRAADAVAESPPAPAATSRRGDVRTCRLVRAASSEVETRPSRTLLDCGSRLRSNLRSKQTVRVESSRASPSTLPTQRRSGSAPSTRPTAKPASRSPDGGDDACRPALAPAPATACAPTAPTIPPPACGSIRPSCSSIPTRVELDRRLRLRPAPRRAARGRDRHRAAGAQGDRARAPAAGRAAAAVFAPRRPDLRTQRPRLHHAPPGRARGAARHRRRARPPGGHRASPAARASPRRADADHRLDRRAPPAAARPDQRLGLQPGRADGARSRACAPAASPSCATRSRRCTPAGIGVDPRPRLQPHRRERRARPDAVACAGSTTRAYCARAPTAR